HGAAEIDIETGPATLAVGAREAGEAGIHAADQRTALLDRAKILTGPSRCGNDSGCDQSRGGGDSFFHVCSHAPVRSEPQRTLRLDGNLWQGVPARTAPVSAPSINHKSPRNVLVQAKGVVTPSPWRKADRRDM